MRVNLMISVMHRVNDGAGTEKHQGFKESVGQDMKHPRRKGTDAQA